jgi:peptide/nickel transport system ATP-binding protein
MIKVDQLRISFGTHEVVRGVSFDVAKGGSFGIVGESGSGKS